MLSFNGILHCQTVSVEDAADYASDVLYNHTGKSIGFDASKAQVHQKSGETVYYTFNKKNSFVIISAEKQFDPVLGYSTKRGLPSDKSELPPAFKAWMDHLAKQIVEVRKKGVTTDKDSQEAWEKIESRQKPSRESKGVSPLLNTTWNQGCGYNGMCPADSDGPCGHVYAGCVATSQAQTMKYHAHPTNGSGQECYTHSDYGELCADFSSATYDWASMPNSSGNAEVEELMYHCGVSVHMNYGPDGSGSYMSNVEDALVEYFEYTDNLKLTSKYSYDLADWEALMRKECDNGRVLPYAGYGSGGHAFVLDGYDDSGNFHFNWGWGGTADGYYSMGNLNPSGQDYSSSNSAIIGVEPSADFTGLDFSGTTNISCATQVSVDLSTGQSVVNTYNGINIDAFGKEKVYKFSTSYSGRITVEITNQNEEISAVLLSSANKDSVLATGTNDLTYDNSNPATYYLVLDAARAQNANCDLKVICPTDEAELIAENVQSHPGAIESNLSGVKFSSTVKNIGNSASSSCEMEYYLSENDTLDGSDLLLATSSIPPLDKDEKANIDTTTTMPVLPEPGSYHLIALPDASNAVPETIDDDYYIGNVTIPDTGSMDCSSAIAIEDNKWYFDNTAANGDSLIDSYSCGTNLTGNEMIYTMTPSNSGMAEIQFSEKHTGQMNLQVFPLCNENANCVSSLSIWNTSDTIVNSSFEVEAGMEYYLVVDGKDDLSGEFGFKVDFPEECPDDTLMYWSSPERCNGDGPFSMSVSWGYSEYQWYKNGSAIEGETSSSYSAESSGEYYAEITENDCTVETDHINVAYSPAPDTAAIEAISDTVTCGSGSVKLEVTAGTSYDIQWYRNGAKIEGATAQQYSAKNSGAYHADVINNSCHLPSNEIDVLVKDQPVDHGQKIPVAKNSLEFHFPLDDDAQDLSGNGYGISNYDWYPIDDHEGNFWQARQFIDPNTYTYIYSQFNNPEEFTHSFWFKSTDGDKGALVSFTDDRYSPGGTVDRTLFLADDGRLHFYLNNSGSPVELVSSDSYDDNNWHHVAVSVGDHAKMHIKGEETVSDPVTLNLDSIAGYWLYGGHDIPSGASNQPSDAYFQGAIDDLRYYNRALDSMAISYITSPQELRADLRKDTVCDNGDLYLEFSHTQPGIEYSLLNADSGDTLAVSDFGNGVSMTLGPLNYSSSVNVVVLAVDTASGCSRILKPTWHFEVLPSLNPDVSISADQGTAICIDDTVTINSSATAPGVDPTYHWLFNGAFSGETGATMAASSLSDGDSVQLVLVSDYQCANYTKDTSEALHFNVGEKPVVDFNVSSLACTGDTFNVEYTGDESGIASINWRLNGQLQSATGAGMHKFVWNESGDLDVTVIVISDYGCEEHLTKTMSIQQTKAPEVTISSNMGTEIDKGDTVTLNSSVIAGGSDPTYDWLINGASVGQTNATMNTNDLSDGDRVQLAMVSDYACASFMRDTSNTLQFSVQSLTSAYNLSREQKIKVYPNPASSEITIECTDMNNKTVNYKLYNITGKCIMEGQRKRENNFTVNVSSLNNGIYLLKIDSGDVIETKRLRINH
jgi:hypothetical protein